jgi:hypothetical protein
MSALLNAYPPDLFRVEMKELSLLKSDGRVANSAHILWRVARAV